MDKTILKELCSDKGAAAESKNESNHGVRYYSF